MPSSKKHCNPAPLLIQRATHTSAASLSMRMASSSLLMWSFIQSMASILGAGGTRGTQEGGIVDPHHGANQSMAKCI